MTLRGRLTTAFLVVVLGPVVLGAFFIGATVATVSRDRAVERLDHAAITVRTAVAALCHQLQAAADAVAVLADDDQRRAAADQLVSRGLITAVRVTGTAGTEAISTAGAPAGGWRDCATPPVAESQLVAVAARAEIRDANGVPLGSVHAAHSVDAALVERLAGASGVAVTLLAGPTGTDILHSTEPPGVRYEVATVATRLTSGATARAATARAATGRYLRRVDLGPGQPLALVVSVPGGAPHGSFGLLIAVALAAVAVAVVAAWWLARSTTRPLAEVAQAADRVAAGDLDARVPVLRQDEVGRLAASFNRMTRELQGYVQALTASRDQLRGHLSILGDTLSSTHDLHRILQVILQTALPAAGARAGVVLLVDPVSGELAGRCAEGLPAQWADITALRVPVGEGPLGGVAATGEPRHGQLARAAFPLSVDGPSPTTYIAVPICAPVPVADPPVPGRVGESRAGVAPAVLGVLALYDRLGAAEFDDADLVTLGTFAGQAGVAVNNVRVHEEAQRLSLTDPLTGLWNYRYLTESIRREVERASRFGRTLTVLLLDLDRFKEVNDTYGHAAGDAVLTEFARRIRVGLREVDLAFRQGGEEFVVLLPETEAFGGATVAERLGAAIRETPVPIGAHRRGATTGATVDRIAISVSIGIAVYPDHGASATELLQAADDALYAAKAAGRDTYRLAGSADPFAGRQIAVAAAPSPADDKPVGAGAAPGPHPPRQVRGR